MKKLLGVLLCSSVALFGAESKVVQIGAFDLLLPEGSDDWAYQVNRFDAQQNLNPPREAGWIVVAAKQKHGSGYSINKDGCMQLAVNMPNELAQSDSRGVTEAPGETLQQYIRTLNSTYALKFMNFDGFPSTDMIIPSLTVFMKYGKTLTRASGKQAEDQSNWVPDVRCQESEFPAEGDVTCAVDGDKDTPIITWTRERAEAEGMIGGSSLLRAFAASLIE